MGVSLTTKLKSVFPQAEKEFLKEKNPESSFELLSLGSTKKVWWQCQKSSDHVWLASPNQRTSVGKLRGCPFCAGKKVAESNSLANTNPELAKEFDTERNGELTPQNISSGSNKSVWWRCKNNDTHLWQASPKQRLKGNNCVRCKSLSCLNPQIASQWHPTKNEKLDPFLIPASSHQKVWWKCDKGFDHVWFASPNSRVSNHSGCPVCSGYKVVKSNSLAVTDPEIASQWDYAKNGAILPENVYRGSHQSVWWKCLEGEDHEWKAAIKTRTNGSGCPICSGRKVVRSNSLATKLPQTALFWHPLKNGNLTAYDITPYSGKMVWWKCPEGAEHEWTATVANVVNGSTCPVCMGRKITSINNFKALHPALIEEWDYEKNKNIDPAHISAGTKIKVWWICKRDPEHQWCATVADRTKKDSGCPICSIKLNVSENKMLDFIKTIFPQTEILYRAKPKWLLRMELDVFIPSRNIGFEYQGVQHLKPIDFFGGQETFISQVKRDKLKKELCVENKIELIYVYYDEKLSRDLILQKLTDAGFVV